MNTQYERPSGLSNTRRKLVRLQERSGKAAALAMFGLPEALSYLLGGIGRYARLAARERLAVKESVGGVSFICENRRSLSRARRTYVKEYATTDWIDGMSPADCFWDIGANLGAFSLYAAKRNIRTYAFEPMPQNYTALCQNISANGFSEQIDAMCIALYNETKISSLYGVLEEAGASLNVFDNAIDYKGNTFTPTCRFSTLSFTVDDVIRIFSLRPPTHMKIDVDGNELDIMEGAGELLRGTALREILIEITPENKRQTDGVCDVLSGNGFHLHSRAVLNQNESVYNAIYIR